MQHKMFEFIPAYGSCSTSGTYFQDQRTDTCLQILSLVGIDETLVNFIKQSTQQRGKGRTKREDPSPVGSEPKVHKTKEGHKGSTKREDPSPIRKRTNPKGVTREGQRERSQVWAKSAQTQRGSQGKEKERGLKSEPKAHKPKGVH
jgi:hypothetical protein